MASRRHVQRSCQFSDVRTQIIVSSETWLSRNDHDRCEKIASSTILTGLENFDSCSGSTRAQPCTEITNEITVRNYIYHSTDIILSVWRDPKQHSPDWLEKNIKCCLSSCTQLWRRPPIKSISKLTLSSLLIHDWEWEKKRSSEGLNSQKLNKASFIAPSFGKEELIDQYSD